MCYASFKLASIYSPVHLQRTLASIQSHSPYQRPPTRHTSEGWYPCNSFKISKVIVLIFKLNKNNFQDKFIGLLWLKGVKELRGYQLKAGMTRRWYDNHYIFCLAFF
jgi:hypothetical protein